MQNEERTKLLIARMYPETGKDAAKLLVWCFLAGYASGFVPNALSKLVGNATGSTGSGTSTSGSSGDGSGNGNPNLANLTAASLNNSEPTSGATATTSAAPPGTADAVNNGPPGVSG